MKKYLVTLMTIVTMAFATGCPDGDDDADADCIPACAPGYVCLYGDCVPEGSDADADDNGADGDSDADADTAETETDASDEGTTSCPSVAGTWEITWLPVGNRNDLPIVQDGCSLTADWDSCIGTGDIYEDASLILDFGPEMGCGGGTRHLTGALTTPTHMAGDWSSGTGGGGTWEATLQ